MVSLTTATTKNRIRRKKTNQEYPSVLNISNFVNLCEYNFV